MSLFQTQNQQPVTYMYTYDKAIVDKFIMVKIRFKIYIVRQNIRTSFYSNARNLKNSTKPYICITHRSLYFMSLTINDLWNLIPRFSITSHIQCSFYNKHECNCCVGDSSKYTSGHISGYDCKRRARCYNATMSMPIWDEADLRQRRNTSQVRSSQIYVKCMAWFVQKNKQLPSK